MVAQTRCDMKLYAERDIISQGRVYTNHVFQMTREGLHSKSDIAAELAHRDIQLAELQKKNAELLAQVSRMQTFIRLAAEKWKDCQELEPTFLNLLRVVNQQPEDALLQIQAEAVQNAIHYVANRYNVEDTSDRWVIGANHVLVLFAKYANRIKAGE